MEESKNRISNKIIEVNQIIAELEEEKLFTETILNSLPGIFYLYSMDGSLLKWNKNYERVTGYSSDELIEFKMIDWFQEKDKAVVQEAVDNVLKYGKGELEVEFLIKNGNKIPYYFTGATMSMGGDIYWLGVGIDLTERKAAEHALQRSEEKYREIFENSMEGIFQKTFDGKFISANPSAAKILGYDSPEDLMESITDIENQLYVSKEKKNEFNEIIERQKEVSGFELQFYRKDRTIIWAELYARSVYDLNGNFRLHEGIFSDITEKKLAADALQQENIRLRSDIKNRYKFEGIIGKSPAMQQVYELIMSASTSGATTIIYGESGTGKELVARAIHNLSNRRKNNFVAVNCGAIPESLLESEFFGYKKGAFTGADKDKEGYLGLANGGTLFLDELGAISVNLQIKLLRVIENGSYRPVGEEISKKVDIRIVGATNQSLKEAVRKGLMREDFYYRIHVLPIHLPPLRERKKDIPLLIDHFLNAFAKEDDIPPVNGEMIETLLNYKWPGNVRELQNVLQRYLSLKKIDLTGGVNSDTSPVVKGALSIEIDESKTFKEAMEQFEKKLISNALKKHKWNREKASQELGIPRRTFFRKIKKYNLS